MCLVARDCSSTDGSVENANICICGTEACTASTGMFCVASSNTCSDTATATSPSPTSESAPSPTSESAPSPTSKPTTSDPVKDRAESTTMIETDIKFDGMSANDFWKSEEDITKTIADTLEVHPSMLIVVLAVSTTTTATVEVQIFVTPEKATAMEEKVKVLKTSGSPALCNTIRDILRKTGSYEYSNTLSATVSNPFTKINQTPPPAPPQKTVSATPSSRSETPSSPSATPSSHSDQENEGVSEFMLLIPGLVCAVLSFCLV